MPKHALSDAKITKRASGAVRIGEDKAIVELTLTRRVLFRGEDNGVDGEETIEIDLLPLIQRGVSVSQSAEDLAAIQTVFPDVNASGTGRVGISILRAILGV